MSPGGASPWFAQSETLHRRSLHGHDDSQAAAVRRRRHVQHEEPIRRSVLGLLEDGRRIGLIDADLDRWRLRRTDRFEEAKRWRRSPRGVDDQVRRETSRRSERVLEPHPRDPAIVGRGDELRHAHARSELDIRLPFDPAAADALQQRARQGELIESEVAIRKRIETRNLEAHVAAHAHSNGAGLDEIELDAWKQMLERAAATCKEPMRMPRLRRPWARRGLVRQCVAVEHNDLFEMGRDGFRRGEASHSGANNDGLFQNRI